MNQAQLTPVTLNCNDSSEAAKNLILKACSRFGVKDAVLNKNKLTAVSLQLVVEFSWFPVFDFPETVVEKIERRVYDVRKPKVVETLPVEEVKVTRGSLKLPTSAKAKWIGLIPSLNFKIIGYETESVCLVQVSYQGTTALFKNSGFLTPARNRGVKEAFEVAGFNLAYAEEFDRTAPHEFVRKMLDNACFEEGLVGKDCYLFETL